MGKEKDLIIFSNSPGEVSGWVSPVVEEINKHEKIVDLFRVFLIIHPCQFSSGKETFVAKSFPGIYRIIPPKQYLKFLVTGSWKRKFGIKDEGFIFSLGGNLKHPVLFKKRMGINYKLYAYTDNPALHGWESNFEKIYVRSDYVKDKYINRGVSHSKIEIIGDLISSSVKKLKEREEVRIELGLTEHEHMFAVLPGSREFEVLYMLPIFLKVISGILDRFDNIKFFILKSPYTTYENISQALSKGGKIKEADSLPGLLREDRDNKTRFISFSKNKEIRILEGGLDCWGGGIDFALCLPGTNTIQLVYREIPCLVVTLLNKPELIPFVGIWSILNWVPFIGKRILRKAFLKYAEKFKYSALPNIYKNTEIVPELFCIFETEDITKKLMKIIEKKEITAIKKRLSQFSLNRDPDQEIVKKTLGKVLQK